MESLPAIFMDLAIILVAAGVITVVFKWLKQPLVLGYIIAGFFISLTTALYVSFRHH